MRVRDRQADRQQRHTQKEIGRQRQRNIYRKKEKQEEDSDRE